MTALISWLVMVVETLGIRATIEHFGRRVFIPPAYHLPPLPGGLRLIPGAQRIYTQTIAEILEKVFFTGVIQGMTFGFMAGVLTVLLILHKKNVVGYAKNVVS